MIKLKNILIKYFIKLIPLLFIISFGILINSWVIHNNNFFYADDWGWFLILKKYSWFNFFKIIPTQMYNDRPIGVLFLKTLFAVFKYNHTIHHTILLCIHILNAIMVYLFINQLVKYFHLKLKYLFFLGAIYFIAWPKSIMAVHWDAAAFDLLSCFFTLIFLNLCMQLLKTKNMLLGILSTIVFLLMVRTKESTLLISIIPIIIIFIKSKPRKLSFNFFKNNLSSLIFILLNIVLTIFYLSYLLILANQSHFMGYGPGSPYYVSLNPFIILRNLFRYIYLFVDIFSSNQVFTRYAQLPLFLSILFIILIMYLLIHKKTQDIAILCVFSLILSLFPVLPLSNMQHKLYLYMPSIFFSIIISLIIAEIHKLSNYYLPVIGLSIFFLYFLNFGYPSVYSEKQWWLDIGKENRTVFNNIVNYPIARQINDVEIINITNETNIFNFGPGDSLKLINNRNLNVILSKDKKNTIQNKTIKVIDYSKLLE